jgi:hypothetical protein
VWQLSGDGVIESFVAKQLGLMGQNELEVSVTFFLGL